LPGNIAQSVTAEGAPYDSIGNGRIDVADVVWLFGHL